MSTPFSPVMTEIVQSTFNFDGSMLEKRSLQYFQEKAVPALSGYFYGEFFGKSVLQLGTSCTSIRHALVALAATFEDECNRVREPGLAAGEMNSFAVASHNLAIRQLLTQLNECKDAESVLEPLVICILFACLDCVRRNVSSALNHVNGGLQLLQSLQLDAGARSLNLSYDQRLFLGETIVPFLSWLRLIGVGFGENLTSPSAVRQASLRLSVPTEFSNIEQALTSLIDTLVECFTFARKHQGQRFVQHKNAEIIQQHLTHLTSLDEFNKRLRAFSASSSASGVQPMGLQMMHAVLRAIRIWFELLFVSNELAYDSYKNDFEDLLRLVAEAVDEKSRSPGIESKLFSLQMPLTAILHFVALKCRWPTLRRQAIHLLSRCPRQEGLFVPRHSIMIANAAVAIEEGVATGGAVDDSPSPNALPPDPCRIYLIDFPPLAGNHLGRPVNFLLKPRGIYGPWHVKSEMVEIKSIELLRPFEVKGSLMDHENLQASTLLPENDSI